MDDLRIDLASFQGPLDLLLHLVMQEEVDIHEVPIARIADRFLAACRGQVDNLDVDQAGEFLVMASQLLVLKSRALLPRETELDLEEIDPRLDLVRQLLEYRDFKQAAETLRDQAANQELKHPARVQGPDRRAINYEDLPLEVDLFALVAAFQRLMRETGEGPEGVAMPKERLPITHFVSEMFDMLTAGGGSLGFRDLVGHHLNRSYVIGAFLALLELMKLRKVKVTQDGLGDMRVELTPEAHDLGDEAHAADALDHPELQEAPWTGPRIVFMGSPAFAVPALRSLEGAGMRPRLVVTPPPERAGRGRRLKQVPLAAEADRLELPLHRTRDVNGRTSRNEIEAVKPDLIITAGFGQKLGPAILGLPKRGCINLHTSILPKYRGASPVAAAIRAGDKETGVTIFVMDAKMDRGPVLATAKTTIEPTETRTQVTAKLADLAADLLVRTLPAYLDGTIEPKEQDHEQATYVGRLEKKDGIIDFKQSATQAHAQIRSVTEWPGAQTSWQPRVKHKPLPLVVLEAAVIDDNPVTAPTDPDAPTGGPDGESNVATEVRAGTVVDVSKEGIDIACEPGTLRILRVKPQGGRPMAVKDFLNARRVVAGDRFVAP